MMMNPSLLWTPPQETRPYSVGATTSDSAYQRNVQQRNARFAAIAEHVSDADGTLIQPSKLQSDEQLQKELLKDYNCENDDPASFDDQPKISTSSQSGSKVTVQRTLRSHLLEASEVDREINVISTVVDPAIPILLESLELKDVIWTVQDYQPLQTIGQLVELNGPMSEEVLKTSLNRLFSGIASLFLAGFAHLRINDKTVCMNHSGQLFITDFKYACQYGQERTDDLYAPTQEKYGDDIFVAPEVFAHHTYNARKAVIWSCGVLIYFMTTGQTNKLSNLAHPSFETTTATPDPETLQQTPPRRSSAFRRRSSATAAAINHKIIHYPSNRFDVPNYVRWTMPRMLSVDPVKRAELIEVCSRIPKDYESKDARQLMEIAWQDYKNHVGPYAGLQHLGAGTGEWSETGSIRESSASSIYSIASAMSNPLASLLGRGHSRSVSSPTGVGRW